ncbi:hypothetical protein B0T11DRAFT_344186 [Plectosphaerella cucumerina]|uniref:Uncharacterized protein n=1 Tax=Plectosphaerella cucumerina TaxID=40658 RepID=A0A8K0TQ00_9PEZI|nr:hypothetical protein B0T11DRAFT_344186 [Plectosphaerella cucumerina]
MVAASQDAPANSSRTANTASPTRVTCLAALKRPSTTVAFTSCAQCTVARPQVAGKQRKSTRFIVSPTTHPAVSQDAPDTNWRTATIATATVATCLAAPKLPSTTGMSTSSARSTPVRSQAVGRQPKKTVPGGYCSAAGHGCSEPGCCRAAFATAMCSEHIMFRFAQHTSAERAEAASRRAQQETAPSRPNVDSAAHQAREKAALRKTQETTASRPNVKADAHQARENEACRKTQVTATSRPNLEATARKAREKADALRAQDEAFIARARDAAIARRNQEESSLLKAQVEAAASKAAAAKRFEEDQIQQAQKESDLRVTDTLFLRQVMAQMSMEEADAKKAKQEAIHLTSKEAEISARAEAIAKDKAARIREESHTSNMAKEPTVTRYNKKVEWDFSSSRSSNTKGFGGPPSQPYFAPIPQEGRREINLLQELDLQRLNLRQCQENEHEEMRLFLWNTNPRQRDDILRDLDAKHEEAADAFEKDARAQLRALRDEKEYRPIERQSHRNNYW